MTVEKNAGLTSVQEAMLEVVQASREAADQRAQRDAQTAEQRDEILMGYTTYKSLAQQEADYLGELMLSIDRQRLVPFAGKTSPALRRVHKDSHQVYERMWLPKIDIGTPLLYPTEVDHFDEVSIVTGWRATTHTIGSDLRQFFAAFRPADNIERERQATGLTLEQVVQSPEDTSSHNPIERVASSDYYGISSAYGRQADTTEHPGMEPDDPYYFEQFSILRAVRNGLQNKGLILG